MFKLLSADLKHFDFQYKVGLNIDTQPFNPKGSCEPGGLYYTDIEHLAYYITDYWPLIAKVEVPDDALVYLDPDGGKWKADRLVLGQPMPVDDFLLELPRDVLLRMAKQSPRVLMVFSKPPVDVFQTALLAHKYALMYLKAEQFTPDICEIAHRYDRLGDHLQHYCNQAIFTASQLALFQLYYPGWNESKPKWNEAIQAWI